jgi:hypothetical protein
MADALIQARQLLARAIDRDAEYKVEPIAADPWVVSSLLQKSIRRGESDIAERAALTFLKLKGSAIWSRFMVIAFEDVGAGSVEGLAMTVAGASDPAWRKRCGGDVRVAAQLARTLAEAPKDRSADYLGAGNTAPAGMTLETKLARVRDRKLILQVRAEAALSASRVGSGGPGAGGSNLDGLLAVFTGLGAPDELVAATGVAAARTREPITVLVPLIWLAANEGQQPSVADRPVPPSAAAGGVPFYALDMHTRLGREAIWRFACENDAVRACLERYVPKGRWRAAAYNAAFYVDAAPVARRLIWDQSDSLEAFGINRDMQLAGVSGEGMRANLSHLNELRAEALAGARPQPGAMPRRSVGAP